MLGLNAAWKTSIINYLKNKIGDNIYDAGLGHFLYIDPKLYYKGLSVIEIDIGGYCWVKDARGEPKNKKNKAFKDEKKIIFVIDSYIYW